MFEDGREIQELADVKRPSPSLRPVFGLSGNTLQIHQNHIEYVRKKRPNRHWAWNHWLKYKLYRIYLSTSIKMFVCVYIYIHVYSYHATYGDLKPPALLHHPRPVATQWCINEVPLQQMQGTRPQLRTCRWGKPWGSFKPKGEWKKFGMRLSWPHLKETQKKKQQQEPSWHVNFNKFCMIFCTPGGVSGPWIHHFFTYKIEGHLHRDEAWIPLWWHPDPGGQRRPLW